MENKEKEIKKCDFCGSNATCLCFQCINYFCDKCHKFIHNMEKNVNHNKEAIDAFAPIDLKCPNHPKIPLNLFCLEEMGKILINFSYRVMLFILSFYRSSSRP